MAISIRPSSATDLPIADFQANKILERPGTSGFWRDDRWPGHHLHSNNISVQAQVLHIADLSRPAHKEHLADVTNGRLFSHT